MADFCIPTSQTEDWIHLLVDVDCLNRFRCKFLFNSVKNWQKLLCNFFDLDKEKMFYEAKVALIFHF